MVMPCATSSSVVPVRRQYAGSQQVGHLQQQQHLQQCLQQHPQQQQQQHCHAVFGRRRPMQQSAAETAALGRRRELLFSGVAAALTGFAGVAALPSQAAVTITMRPKSQLKPYTLKAGYTVTAPDTWALAYDRSDDEKSGTQAFFGNFRTFETLAILKMAKPEGDLNPQQLLEWVLAEQKNNQSTYDFKLLSGDTPTQRTAPAAEGSAVTDAYYDSQYSLAICRGVIQEGAGGSRRCIGPRDMDLEVVSRTFYQTFAVRQDNIYIIRGSSTSQQWQDVQAIAQEAVQSFRLPAALL